MRWVLRKVTPPTFAAAASADPPKQLDRVRDRIRRKRYSIRTEKSYAYWIKGLILFHGKRHPQDMGAAKVKAFRTSLAMDRDVATTMLCSHVLNKGGRSVVSPLDQP